ncbi:uncharacterized protein LOC121389871 [Gigantopelta aegis]|uniref:uncharacterized protein LOC121389871 n=1 Tax=Gigantopelta aegis TaxID=1735272 RepID=UPI001B8875C3|nr:uncharacterized protein LOC121389871 [Gigantopelta aegis]
MAIILSTTVVFFGVCFGILNAESPFSAWNRKLTMSDGQVITVSEHAEIVGTKQILMNSVETALKDARIYRSQSYHDFNTGVLGIKYIPFGEENGAACMIGQVSKNYETTLGDLTNRAGSTIDTCQAPKQYRAVDEITNSGSADVDNFCGSVPMYQMKLARFQLGVVDIVGVPLLPWRVQTVCIYGPIDWFFTESVPMQQGLFNPGYPY